MAAESAVCAVRQRADSLQCRVTGLERELATEKASAAERCGATDTELSKLKRRVTAVQREAAKWKTMYEAESVSPPLFLFVSVSWLCLALFDHFTAFSSP